VAVVTMLLLLLLQVMMVVILVLVLVFGLVTAALTVITVVINHPMGKCTDCHRGACVHAKDVCKEVRTSRPPLQARSSVNETETTATVDRVSDE